MKLINILALALCATTTSLAHDEKDAFDSDHLGRLLEENIHTYLDLLDVVHETCSEVVSSCQVEVNEEEVGVVGAVSSTGGRARILANAVRSKFFVDNHHHRSLRNHDNEDEDHDHDHLNLFNEEDFEDRPETYFAFAGVDVSNEVSFIQAELGYGMKVDSCVTNKFVHKLIVNEECYDALLETENIFQEIVAESLAVLIPAFLCVTGTLFILSLVILVFGCVSLCRRTNEIARRNQTRNVLFSVWENEEIKSLVAADLHSKGIDVVMGARPPLPMSVINEHENPNAPKGCCWWVKCIASGCVLLWLLSECPITCLTVVGLFYVVRKGYCKKCGGRSGKDGDGDTTVFSNLYTPSSVMVVMGRGRGGGSVKRVSCEESDGVTAAAVVEAEEKVCVV